MKFTNDRQRRATFWAMKNKFAARSETGESLRPILVAVGKEQAMATDFDPDHSVVSGYTGARLIPPIYKHELPYVYESLDSPKIETGDTIILAGEDYKRYEGGIDPRMRKYRGFISSADKVFGTDKHNKEMVFGLAKIDRERGRPVYSKRPNISEMENDIIGLKVSRLDALLSGGCLTEGQNEVLRSNRKKFESGEEFSRKHPKAIGSVWEGDKFIHGPRIRDPDEFEFVKNVEPSAKFFHLNGSDKLPKSLPNGSKIVVGKLKGSEDWAIQSTLIPKDSSLGKSLSKEV